MKSILVLLISTSALIFNKCSKQVERIPSCISQKIEVIKAQPKWNPPAEVNEYLYNGKRVFLFSSNCCDQYNELFDENCTYICAPSGGITGSGDRKCTDFNTSAKHVKLIWKDSR